MKHILCPTFIVLLVVHCVQAAEVPFVELKGYTGTLSSAIFSPDGKKVLTSSWDGTARIWDADTGKELQKLETTHHSASISLSSVAFSPDGKKVVTAGGNGVTIARIWDISAVVE